jgi:hypothetical protein
MLWLGGAMEDMHCTLGCIFPKEGSDRIDDDHTEDCQAEGEHPFAGLHEFCGECQAGGDPEQHGQEVGELVEDPSNQ